MITLSDERVLVVEDDVHIRNILSASLQRNLIHVDSAADGSEALALLRTHRYRIVLVDLMLPRVSGFELLTGAGREMMDRDTIILVMTAFDARMTDELPSNAAHGVIRKPFDLGEVTAIIAECMATIARHHGVSESTETGSAADPPSPR